MDKDQIDMHNRKARKTDRAPASPTRCPLTTDVLLHPGEGDASLLTALTEAQQEGTRRLRAQDGPLPLLTNETQNIPAQTEREQREKMPFFFNGHLHRIGQRKTERETI